MTFVYFCIQYEQEENTLCYLALFVLVRVQRGFFFSLFPAVIPLSADGIWITYTLPTHPDQKCNFLQVDHNSKVLLTILFVSVETRKSER